MYLQRELRVIGSEQAGDEPRVLVAFATSDGARVDQHFGTASCFVVYSVAKTTATLARIGEFATNAHDHGMKLAEKLDWIGCCDAVYATAVGSSASGHLLARGVLPLRVFGGSSIQSLIEALQEDLEEDASHWLDRALRIRRQALAKRKSRKAVVQQEE